MKVTIFNDTPHTFRVKEGSYYPVTRSIGTILPEGRSGSGRNGSSFHYEFFVDTYVDWNLFLYRDINSLEELALEIPGHDNVDAREIRIYETANNEIQHWISVPRDPSKELPSRTPAVQDLASFAAMKRDISTRMKTAESSCMNLEELLQKVKICHAQCEHLVQTYSKGIREMIETYSKLGSNSHSEMWSLYESQKLRLLSSSVDRLLCSVKAADSLLQDCSGKDLERIALVVSMPPPKVETYTRFALLIRELSWALDVIDYASKTKNLEFEWSEERRRYVLEREGETYRSVADVESLAGGVDARLVHDRKNLLSQIISREIFSLQHASSSSAAENLNLPGDFAAVVKKRLQEISDSHSHGSVPTCFQINHLHLDLDRRLSRGSFKKIYVGKWFGQRVAIAKIKETTRDIVEKEAGFMVKVQHPNIVDFFGYAIEVQKKKKKNNPLHESGQELGIREENEKEQTIGYLVMEIMEEDLRSLIDREAKNHSGAPFSLSVSVDLLLQLVEAMLHLQKHNVIYRDLKANNCLVSRRPKVSVQDPDGYTLKLIDFGTCKILESENDETTTIDVGSRRWMAPEIWGIKPGASSVNSRFGSLYPSCFFTRAARVKQQERPNKAYTRSVDVYSFAMTCYEITTGLLPFHNVKNRDVPNMIFREERPSFLHPAAFSCPVPLQTLMTQCWAQDPKDRPRFEDVRRELWKIKYTIEVQR